MAETKTGQEVVAQARDNSLANAEPVALRSTIVGIISAVLAILFFSGIITEEQKRAIEEQSGIIVPALLVLVPILAGIVSRLAAFSPRTAARIAIANAQAPAGAPATLISPP